MNTFPAQVIKFQRAVKRVFKLVAILSSAAGPLLAAMTQMFPPPPGRENIKYIAAVFSLLFSSIVFAYRDLLARSLEYGTVRERWAPLFSGLLALVGSFGSAIYFWRTPASDLRQILLYLFLWPFLLVPATILILCFYYSERRDYRFHRLVNRLGPDLGTVEELIRNIITQNRLGKSRPVLAGISALARRQLHKTFEGLKQGRIDLSVDEMPGVFKMLSRLCKKFDAVSVGELPFWVYSIEDSYGADYFLLTTDLVKTGKTVTRLFVLLDDAWHQADILVEVLTKHWREGIACAVVLFDELPEDLRQMDPGDLDIGLWDSGLVSTKFRYQASLWNRTIHIEISLGRENCEVRKKADLFAQMLGRIWLVQGNYAELHQDLAEKFRTNLAEYNVQLSGRLANQVKPGGDFFLHVTSEQEIRFKVDALYEMWALIRAQRAPRERRESLLDNSADAGN